MSDEGWVVVRSALMAVAFTALMFVLTALICGCAQNVKPTYERAVGQPLDSCDVTEYDHPAWLPACDHAYKVIDRSSHRQWWLLVMNEGTSSEGYVVLPIEEVE